MRLVACALFLFACSSPSPVANVTPVASVATTTTAPPPAATVADRDGDGVPDYCDYCPGEPGIDRPDHPYGRGCPYIDQFVSTVDFAGEPIRFTSGVSYKASLDAIAAGMKANTTAVYFVIGHASPDEPNVDALSLQRANVIRDALIALGVAPQHIEAYGAGAAHPERDSKFIVDKAASRRVTFDASYDHARKRAWDAAQHEVAYVPLPDLCTKKP